MAKTIGQLTQATTINNADELVIEQSGLTKRVAASVVRGGLVNADIDAAADIAGSKLADDAVTTAKILDANVTPAKLSQPLTLATAQATTSGTSIDFTGIPSWVKRITVMFNGVSVNGTAAIAIRAGTSSGLASSGYTSACASISYVATDTTNGSGSTKTDSFLIDGYTSTAASAIHGSFVLTNVSANVWAGAGTFTVTGVTRVAMLSGTVSLGGTLDRVAVVANVVSSQSFDAGSVNIMYEG
jgi:hypothetical protein